MKNRWDDAVAQSLPGDVLSLRVYTSRLLGAEADLVLHGGGNTSVKARVKNFFGDEEDVLYVKGSGWDLETIESAGFAPVRLSVLQRLAELEHLSDAEMVTQQRAAMLNPHAPNPSVEAILHAIIPYQFVDHTHADAVVTLTNTPTGADRIREVYGDGSTNTSTTLSARLTNHRILLIPYVMPGFILAKEIRNLTKDINWHNYDGMILMNHGIFTFADDARLAYDRMIELVTLAEDYLRKNHACIFAQSFPLSPTFAQKDLVTLAKIRKAVSEVKGAPMIAQLDDRAEAIGFANMKNVSEIATRGPITPDHVIRTKSIPVILQGDVKAAVTNYANAYHDYFLRNHSGHLKELDPAPRWAVWPHYGTISFDRQIKSAQIITDIVQHTRRAIQMAERLDRWQALGEKDLFDMEYWELEQAKLGKGGTEPELLGKVALVTGAASGIGKACMQVLSQKGAAVVGLDINHEITSMFNKPGLVGVRANVVDEKSVKEAVHLAVKLFGGLDILVSNAGIFPASQPIETLSPEIWQQSLDINLSSQRILLQAAIPFLKEGIDPAIVFIASRNVPAPGPGAAAYSVAKAGLTQLARVAALELAGDGIRVNVLHPDCVYDTGIWSPEVLESRAKGYGLTVDEYKTRNLLKQAVTSQEVAAMVAAMAGKLFAKTTGAQVPIDGGNDRVI